MHDDNVFDINPANGLPMIDSVFDICGNVFGTDSNESWVSDWDTPFDSDSNINSNSD